MQSIKNFESIKKVCFIVTKTIKNGISISIDTSKDLTSMLIPNKKGSLNMVLPIKSYEHENICLIFEKGRETPLDRQGMLMKIAPSDFAFQKALL